MARWIKDPASKEEDIRINLIIKAASNEDAQVHRALSTLQVRGAGVQAVRIVLRMAERSGLLHEVIASLQAGLDPSDLKWERDPRTEAPTKSVAATAAQIEQIRALNRF